MSVRVIGLSGKAGVGKDFVAQWIHQRIPNSMIMAFADQMKIMALVKYSLSYNDLFHDKTPVSRMLLQQFGTEHGRDKIGKDVWIQYLNHWMTLHHERQTIDTFIITDCRFENEIEFVKSFPNHTVLRIVAPIRNKERMGNDMNTTTHSSECSLDNRDDLFDCTLYNDPDFKIEESLNAILL